MKKRWVVVIVGQESGYRTEVEFFSFWRKRNADLAVAKLNAKEAMPYPLTKFEVSRVRRR